MVFPFCSEYEYTRGRGNRDFHFCLIAREYTPNIRGGVVPWQGQVCRRARRGGLETIAFHQQRHRQGES